MGNQEHEATAMEMPVGYRFLPTDLELVLHYLQKKVSFQPVPAQVIKDIDASELYSKPPNRLVENSCSTNEKPKEGFFFIHHHQDKDNDGKKRAIRTVGDEIGFWRSLGGEDPIYNSNGDVFAFKCHLTYFSGSLPKAKRTPWRMEEYRMQDHQIKKECVLARIKNGRDYNNSL